VLARLVEAGTLTSAQAEAVLEEAASEGIPLTRVENAPGSPPAHPGSGTTAAVVLERPAWMTVLAEIGAYIGGAFIVGAAAVLIADNWDSLSTVVRLAVFDVPAVLLLVAAWAVARPASLSDGDDESERGTRLRMIAVFFTVAAALLGLGPAVIADVTVSSEPVRAASAFWTSAVVAGTGYLLFHGLLLHTATGFALIWAALTTVAATPLRDDVGSSASLIVLALVWAVLTHRGVLRERELGYAVAGIAAFIGGETLIDATFSLAGYSVLGLLAVAGMAGFVFLRAFALLVTGVGTLAVVVPQFVIDMTEGALGAAGALLLVGLSIVGASLLGLRLRRWEPPAVG
jgi:hypothetical protein